MEYNLKEHKHRFAIWTAARSVQRAWTTTKNISQVIHAVRLFEFAETFKNITAQQEFDKKHMELCENMIKEFQFLNVDNVCYGRVAKIIAIYLKTFIVLNATTDDEKAMLIHPPVDRILLKNLSSKKELNTLRKLNWTQLDKNGYWQMVDVIRNQLGFFDWRIEEDWRPELEDY